MADQHLRELERAHPDRVPDELVHARMRAGLCPWCGAEGGCVIWSAGPGPTCCCSRCYTGHPEGPWQSAGRVEGGYPHGAVVCARCPLKDWSVLNGGRDRSYPCPGPVPPVVEGQQRPWSPMHPPRPPEGHPEAR